MTADPSADGPGGSPAGALPDEKPSVPAGADESVDLGRRRFFREFLTDTVQAAATLFGAATALQKSSAEAATNLLNLSQSTALEAPAEALAAGSQTIGYRSPFRLDGEKLVLLDQRVFPTRIHEIECRTGAETAAMIRDGVVLGPASMAQAAAYGLSLTVTRSITSSMFARRAIIRGSAQALQNSAPSVMLLRRAMVRMIAIHDEMDARGDEPERVAGRLREEADSLVLETTHAHARLSEVGRLLLPEVDGRRLRVLLHGPVGPLACGQVGSAFGVVQAAVAAGVPTHVYVAETRPSLVGSRLVAWELAQAGIPYTVLADGAAGWLLASGQVDTVLVGAATIAMNGDVVAEAGTYPIAALAARHGVPFHVCAPIAAVDPSAATGADVVPEMRDGSQVVAIAGTPLAPSGSEGIVPAYDVTPAELVTSLVTEHGLIGAPYRESIASALDVAGLSPEPAEDASAAAEPEPASEVAPIGPREASA